ncbi:LysM peptidoglycan-binding domain-containing protein [Companilactobacillus ginsenosidimutans]|uniref:LysM domain-containing protein n=1 Tax=Companilactobacillus ginsenosidimutans TaxID=1007676 RepID=A0A0H4QIM3_9LACO|nr:LysM peptidoglycan-binding domain-containing protein [Companilactobacillus ginsenosidimutans]AKP66523.1 hypothetical protein ABM34_02460 [Companilactobacillus ginsenosidimutans]
MPENNNKNTSGSKVPASTEGLSRKGSVSPEDLRKYNLVPSDSDTTPANTESVVGKDVGTSSDFVNNVPRSNPNTANQNSDENIDHLQASKQNDEMKTAAAVGAGVAAGSAMSKNNNTQADSTTSQPDTREEADGGKPWENKFDSDEDESGHVSRAVSKSKQRGNHTLVAILVIILIALMFIPVTLYFVRGDNNGSNLGSDQTEQSVEKQDKDTAKKSTSKKKSSTKKTTPKKKASSTKKKSSSKSSSGTVNENTDNSTAADQSNQAAQTDNSAQQTQDSSSTAASDNASGSASGSGQSGASYATVGQGQGWYRVAVNNGLSIEQLKGLNPGVTNLAPGTQLRIK